MEFRVLAEGLAFPEGPIAMADGTILVVEIATGKLTRISDGGRADVVAQIGGGPNGVAIGPDGFCYICNNGGFRWHRDAFGLRPVGQSTDYAGGRIERVDLRTGKVERLYDGTVMGPLKGPNDLVFDRSGGFWFTDAGKTRERESDRGGVYYARADGSLITEVIYPMLVPNGIGLSPSGDTLYVSETPTGRVWQFRIAGPGQIAPEPWPSPNGGTLLAGLPGYQLCDSLAVQADGTVCVATLINGGVNIIPADGSSIRHVALPDKYTTNIAFGGADMRSAYVTLSQSGRLVAMDWDTPGLVLNATG